MTPDEFESEIKIGLAAVLYVAAARADAEGDPERLARLRETIGSEGTLRYEETGDPDAMLAEIRSAMGGGWEPTGEWAKKLKEVLGE